MIQKDIYKKDIERPINGVIKADSTAELTNEIIEYVITDEQQQERLLPSLFASLAPEATPACVWISGDFGSGKSHLLKILSYVLQNKLEIEGRKCSEIFAEKAKDFELKGSIINACRVPTECILFNIQDKFDGITKGGNNIDPVLNIFLKEFNRCLGYDDKKPEIAEIERYFDEKGQYEYLKSEYRKRFGESWEEARKSILLKLQKLAEIMADIEGISKDVAYTNIQAQIKNYTLDIDGFVALVRKHLAKQTSGSRLIFFVDEVGQFIGKDVNRMLSLQTIAEGLIDKIGGRALIMVTSQMDLDASLGNLEKQQEYDFSRIQGRFTTRINLTSANADEVIQRRLLEKKEEPHKYLCEVYEQQKNVIKTLFNFGDRSQFKTNYKNADQFAIDFPFIDYQFDLLQRAVIELSKNNAFTGRQQSVGERSLLTITQDVAKSYKEKDLSRIIRFSDMYEGIRGILQTKVQSDIQQAEKTLNDDFALSVLKALFLVKYVKGFPSTVDNITKILLPSLNEDIVSYKEKVKEALNKLVRVSFIEKGANDEYHYQTNEEKDIENEIKNEDLQPDAINNELKKIFRDEIYSDAKVKLSANKVYSYGRYVDDSQEGKDADFYIHFITPLNMAISPDETGITMYSLGHPNHLCVLLDEDKYLTEDITMFKKADKCLTRLLASNSDSYRQQIITDKRRVNQKRRESIVQRLTDLTRNAKLYIYGQEVTKDLRFNDLKGRLSEAMGKLVEQVYTNLKMLTIECDDALLKSIIANKGDGFDFGDELDNCATEIMNWIFYNKRISVRTTGKLLIDHFKGGTHGWYETATICVLAKLYREDKVSLRINGNLVDERNLYTYLTNSNQQTLLIIDIEETITNAQVTKLKNLYKELFNDESCLAQSAKDVHAAFISRLSKEIDELKQIKFKHHYDFCKPIDTILTKLQDLSTSIYPSLYSKTTLIEDIIDLKLDEVDAVCEFVNGRQFEIFKRIDVVVNGNQANLSYVPQDLLTSVKDIYLSKTPWKEMKAANGILDTISEEISRKQEDAKNEIAALINSKKDTIFAVPAYSELESYQQNQVKTIFDVFETKLKEERFIGNIIAMADEIGKAYDNCINSINHWIDEKRKAEEAASAANSGGQSAGSGSSQPATPVKKIRKVVNKQKAMAVQFGKQILESKEDVEEYIELLKKQLLDYINKDNNIMLN